MWKRFDLRQRCAFAKRDQPGEKVSVTVNSQDEAAVKTRQCISADRMGHVMARENDSIRIDVAFELLLQKLMHHRFGIPQHFHLRPRQIQPRQQRVAILFGGIEGEPINILDAGPGAVEAEAQRTYRKLI